jgi:hypothetical protein
MDDAIYCLVDARGRVYFKDGAASYADVAAGFGLDERDCQEYRFDLARRALVEDRPTPSSLLAAGACLNRFVGSPDRLMQFAEDGHLPKNTLADLLTAETRDSYLRTCGAIEKAYTEACTAQNDPCLESGCAVEGEICLQPLLRAGAEYQKACAAEWIKKFRNPRNRIDVWKN